MDAQNVRRPSPARVRENLPRQRCHASIALRAPNDTSAKEIRGPQIQIVPLVVNQFEWQHDSASVPRAFPAQIPPQETPPRRVAARRYPNPPICGNLFWRCAAHKPFSLFVALLATPLALLARATGMADAATACAACRTASTIIGEPNPATLSPRRHVLRTWRSRTYHGMHYEARPPAHRLRPRFAARAHAAVHARVDRIPEPAAHRALPIAHGNHIRRLPRKSLPTPAQLVPSSSSPN